MPTITFTQKAWDQLWDITSSLNKGEEKTLISIQDPEDRYRVIGFRPEPPVAKFLPTTRLPPMEGA